MTSKRGSHVVGEATLLWGPEAAGLARTMVSGSLDGRAAPELVADACLLVSELVTNSIRHADDSTHAPVHVSVTTLDGVVRVEVTDQGHGAVRRRAPNLTEGGFGLDLVEQIAARWGVEHDASTQVWFELAPCSDPV
jgi:anti-sigma regulatory factor (Ser/Thr protein kinase)